jgi:hypothetical protein
VGAFQIAFARRHAVALACLLVALVIAVSATVDHHVKQARAYSAEKAEWYCGHVGTQCGGPSSGRIESRWNDREWVYAIVFSLFAGYGTVRLVFDVFADRASPGDPTGDWE